MPSIAKSLVNHIDYCLRQNRKADILVMTSSVNVQPTLSAVIQFVFEKEGMLPKPEYDYKDYAFASEFLEYSHNVRLDIVQRPEHNSKHPYLALDTGSRTKIYYDHT